MGFIAWIVVGLIAGWLAGQVMKGGGYGILVDIVLGILGGIVGGCQISDLLPPDELQRYQASRTSRKSRV
jgi:uncharacterized membrane protein YeaQ/YmgE (transglycosylase-associated protein family)